MKCITCYTNNKPHKSSSQNETVRDSVWGGGRGATKSRAQWCLPQTMSTLFVWLWFCWCGSGGLALIPGFLASLPLLCFSLLSTFFTFIGQPGPSCEMGFSRATGACALMDRWLIGSNQKIWTVSHSQVFSWSLTHLSTQWKHKEIRAITVRKISHQLLLNE